MAPGFTSSPSRDPGAPHCSIVLLLCLAPSNSLFGFVKFQLALLLRNVVTTATGKPQLSTKMRREWKTKPSCARIRVLLHPKRRNLRPGFRRRPCQPIFRTPTAASPIATASTIGLSDAVRFVEGRGDGGSAARQSLGRRDIPIRFRLSVRSRAHHEDGIFLLVHGMSRRLLEGRNCKFNQGMGIGRTLGLYV